MLLERDVSHRMIVDILFPESGMYSSAVPPPLYTFIQHWDCLNTDGNPVYSRNNWVNFKTFQLRNINMLVIKSNNLIIYHLDTTRSKDQIMLRVYIVNITVNWGEKPVLSRVGPSLCTLGNSGLLNSYTPNLTFLFYLNSVKTLSYSTDILTLALVFIASTFSLVFSLVKYQLIRSE